jgi:hypothetical protein
LASAITIACIIPASHGTTANIELQVVEQQPAQVRIASVVVVSW